MSFTVHPAARTEAEGKELCDFCVNCTQTRVAQMDGPRDSSTGLSLYRKGEFIISCKGIPKDDKFLPSHDKVIAQIEQENGKLAEDDKRALVAAYDPVTWADLYLDWQPRKSRDGEAYQENILRCSSNRKVLRCGRRLGKSEVMIVWALYRLFNYSPKEKRWDETTQEYQKGFSTIMFVAPYLSQVKDYFTRLREFVYNNPELKADVISDVSTPFFKLELRSGMKILGFSAGSSGAASVRGQKADWLVFDEMDYLDQEAINALMPLIMEHGEVEMIAASTPSGRRDYFYEFCTDRMNFKEFYYPSSCNPSWGPQMEAELRGLYRTEVAWSHEILAEFGEASTSVFQMKYVQKALGDYVYENLIRIQDCKYIMGVDWNDTENGTKIRVVEWDPMMQTVRAVAARTVQKAGWTQTTAIDEMVKLNRDWDCDYIYVDAGYGATQIELLKKLGQEAQFRKDKWAHRDMNFIHTVGINSSSKIDIFDPVSGLPKKMPMKPYMVESSVRFFEKEMFTFPKDDEMLFKQLHGYSIAKVNASGMPIYEAGPSGDHDLDALMLCFLGLEIELGQHTNRTYSSNVAFAGRIGEKAEEEAPQLEPTTQELIEDVIQKPRRPEVRSSSISSLQPRGLLFGQGQATSRTYSRDAFNNDDQPRQSGSRQNAINHVRQLSRRSRRIL